MGNLRSEYEIMEGWPIGGNLVVSICCAAFNHEMFIEDALDSFLMQQTNFPFEIIIRDDCSSDDTASIIRRYVEKYPNLIRPIYEQENQYSKGVSPFLTCMQQATGDYIAICEGDDYWTDEKKLQLQVNFLEDNKEFVVSGHDAYTMNNDGNIIQESKLPDRFKRDFDAEELILGKAWILTMSMVFRNILKNSIPYELQMVHNKDTFLTSILGQHGKSKFHAEIKPACYRVHEGGIWSLMPNKDKHYSQLNTKFWISRYYTRIGQQEYGQDYLKNYYRAALSQMNLRLIVKELLNRAVRILKSEKHKI